jgi:hypothetical protein
MPLRNFGVRNFLFFYFQSEKLISLKKQTMADKLQAALQSVCSDKQQQQNSLPPIRNSRYFTSRNLVLEAEQLEEYADALEAIEE